MATVTGAYGSGNVDVGVTAANVFRPNVDYCIKKYGEWPSPSKMYFENSL